ncbi:helix-turn-helix domain-containing protein [Acetobacterium bakii]|uniref:AraC family transcriptional regulator n=1 Tax=Acetobacterium bakii TaxID=52689 RepID=A0A0L6U4G8_9FIRM|nr:helix-turn-helix domain-containing protein [Acetobacterium bakii]KNZ43404.1 AraC family transcriptional regulator [Acetobacterium bakii]
MISKQNNIIVSPKQPYFVMAASRYYKAVVMDYGISHFYCFQNDLSENSVIAVPDGSIDILFCCDEKEPYATICGTVLQPKIVRNVKNYFFGVRFLPGQSFKFKNIAMKDFVEHEVPLLDVINDNALFEKITSSRDFNYQIQTFMTGYLKFYTTSQASDKYVDLKKQMLQKINDTGGQIKVKELADEAGYSVRYINRVFSEEFGLSPKLFCKLMRFQHLLSNLNDFDKDIYDTNLAQLAIELGYYDQSHMIKDFYELTNTTPGKYVHSLKEKEYKKRLIVV